MDLSICNWPIDIGWIVSAMGVSSGFTSSSKMDPILYMVFEIGMHTSTMPSQLEILGSGYIPGPIPGGGQRGHFAPGATFRGAPFSLCPEFSGRGVFYAASTTQKISLIHT